MINNILSHTVHNACKSTSPAKSSGSFDINKSFVSDIVSVKQYSSSLNRHGNTFQGFSNGVALTRPGTIKSIYAQGVEKRSAEAKSNHNPLNRHGNTFQGFSNGVALTRPGTIKSIYAQGVEKRSAEAKSNHNPLNRHGNTFQGFSNGVALTRPGTIKSIYAQGVEKRSAEAKSNHNPLNRHGNTFQGFSNGVALTRPERIKVSSTHHSGTTDHGATSAHDRSVELISNINFEESDLDMYLFSDYNLFPEKIQIAEPDNEISTGSRSELTETPFNPDYYKLAFLD